MFLYFFITIKGGVNSHYCPHCPLTCDSMLHHCFHMFVHSLVREGVRGQDNWMFFHICIYSDGIISLICCHKGYPSPKLSPVYSYPVI